MFAAIHKPRLCSYVVNRPESGQARSLVIGENGSLSWSDLKSLFLTYITLSFVKFINLPIYHVVG